MTRTPLASALSRGLSFGLMITSGCSGAEVRPPPSVPVVDMGPPSVVTPPGEVARFEVVPGLEAKEIAGGYDFFCAIRTDERVACWVDRDDDGLDEGTAWQGARPMVIEGIERAFRIAAGDKACTQLRNGQVRCWDEGRYARGERLPVLVSAPPEWPRALAIGARYAAIVTADRGVAAWVPLRDVPVRIEGFGEAVDVVSGNEHVCALHEDRTVACVGEYDGGCPAYDERVSFVLAPVELPTPLIRRRAWGDEELEIRAAPVAEPGSRLTGVVDIDAGVPTCAVLDSGRVACWGFHWLGAEHRRCGPFFVPGMSGARGVAVGASFVCAIVRGGRVSCWGSNDGGELGRPPEPETGVVPEARLVPGLAGVHELAASADTVCARRGTEVVCWGGERRFEEALELEVQGPEDGRRDR